MLLSNSGRRFRVALSFPGEHRPRVEAIANLLREELGAGKVLYDKWYEAEFARPNLDVYLPNLYHDESDLIVFFFSAEYNQKEWCGLEWRAGRDLLKGMQDSRLMFLKLDSANPVGLLSIDGYMRIDERPDTEVVAGILERLHSLTPPRAGAGAVAAEVSMSKLPVAEGKLIGRDAELAKLESAWAANANFAQIFAPGGTGKTAVMTKWYMRRVGQVPIFGWSFYRQGTSENSNVSSDEFLQAAVDWFHLQPKAETPDARGRALVHHLRGTRALLILDGLEPLQDHATGDLRDLTIKDLLRELAVQNAGLVLCTSRVRLSDIPEDEAAVGIELYNLSEAEGARYLREEFGVHGTEEELREASRAYDNHALALTLLGSYLKRFGGDISRRFEIDDLPVDDRRPGRHARRVMQSYAVLFKGKPEGEILRGLGFFGRPAEPEALKLVLRKRLNEEAMATLREARLIISSNATTHVDCHPLVREYFGALTRSTEPEAFRATHSRLFDFYRGLPKKEQPDTLEELTPLFYAVGHGCYAGRYKEAREKVYRDRILRGTGVFYLTNILGAFGIDLGLLAHFFESHWIQPVSTLSAADPAWVLSQAAYALRALGRLAEAVEPMQAGAEAAAKLEHWKNAAIGYSNLSELQLTLGRIVEAIAMARISVDYANRSQDTFQRLARRTTLAAALHQSGSGDALAEAALLFGEANKLQIQQGPQYPAILSSLQGYRYCDFLLNSPATDKARTAEVLSIATQALEIAQRVNRPADIGLDHVTLGRAHACDSLESRYHLDQAVTTLRRSGRIDYLPLALLARRTDEDLREVHRIASRSGMKLHLTDYHLGMAGRHRSLEHLEQAEMLIRETGYHRRDSEAAGLRKQLASAADEM